MTRPSPFIQLDPIRNLFRKMEEGHGRAEEEMDLTVRGRILTLRIRISRLRDGSGTPLGSVITFDDLTELIRAKKAETWQDVARQDRPRVQEPAHADQAVGRAASEEARRGRAGLRQRLR